MLSVMTQAGHRVTYGGFLREKPPVGPFVLLTIEHRAMPEKTLAARTARNGSWHGRNGAGSRLPRVFRIQTICNSPSHSDHCVVRFLLYCDPASRFRQFPKCLVRCGFCDRRSNLLVEESGLD